MLTFRRPSRVAIGGHHATDSAQQFPARLFALALTAALAAGAGAQTAMPAAGHLYAMTNAAVGNAVVHYGRGADGKLTRLETPRPAATARAAFLCWK